MRVSDEIYLRDVAVEIPATRDTRADAVADGWLTPDLMALCSVESVPVAKSAQDAEELTLNAARRVLAGGDVAPRRIGLLVHSAVSEPPDGWKAAPRLARLLGADRAVAFGVRQTCNGTGIGLQVAVSHLLTEPRTEHALVLTGDTLGPDEPRRWNVADIGGVLGDSASAILLSRAGGALAIRSVASSGRSAQERITPDLHPFRTRAQAGRSAAPMGAAERLSIERAVREAARAALGDAGLTVDDPRLAVVVLPRLEEHGVAPLVAGVRAELTGARIVHLAGADGHLFASDLAANLGFLLAEGLLPPGGHGLVINVGIAFSVTCLVVRATGDGTGVR